jgi:hypothetical protein
MITVTGEGPEGAALLADVPDQGKLTTAGTVSVRFNR